MAAARHRPDAHGAGDGALVALVATPAGEALYRSLGFAETSGGSRALFVRQPPAPAAPEKRSFG
jgi:hypothetical protein